MDKNRRASTTTTTRVQWSIFALWVRFMWCASVNASPFNGLLAESLCQVEHNNRTYLMTERRIDSSVSLDLKPSSISGPCKQIFDAPQSHKLYVRLHPVLVAGEKNKQDLSAMGGGSQNMNVGQRMVRNTTSVASCPINIYQTTEKSIPPVRLDPCQMNGAEASHLLSAPLRIVWQHSHNWPNYKLTVTAYGDGEVCEQEGKHPCLRIGQQKLICISEDLLCDTIQHCPSGSLYDSDESPTACDSVERKKNQLLNFIKELMKKTYSVSMRPTDRVVNDGEPVDASSSPGHHQTTSFSVMGNESSKTILIETVIDTSANIRKNFPRGLSKYGPWGYLMLGMLLCGGALLVCGLWECCCRKQKPVTPLNAGSLETHQQQQQVMNVNTITSTYSTMQHQNRSDSMQAVINYDETEPPPSYSVLFPNQKDVDDDTRRFYPGTSTLGE